MKKNKIILFDLDGTLIDSTEAIYSTFLYVFRNKNFDFKGQVEDIIKQIGYPLDIMFANLEVPKEKVWDFVEAYKNRYKDISVAQTTLLENAFEAVNLASKIARLGVVTTKTRIYSTPILNNFDILKHFEVIIGREDVENPKPHPEPILKALEKLNYNSVENMAFMIGDTKLDLISANASKINSIGVLCGYSNEEELLKYTNIVKKDALEAVSYIAKL